MCPSVISRDGLILGCFQPFNTQFQDRQGHALGLCNPRDGWWETDSVQGEKSLLLECLCVGRLPACPWVPADMFIRVRRGLLVPVSWK